MNPGQGFVTSKLDSIARDLHCPIHFLSKSGIKLLLMLSRYIIVIRIEIQNVLLHGHFVIKQIADLYAFVENLYDIIKYSKVKITSTSRMEQIFVSITCLEKC